VFTTRDAHALYCYERQRWQRLRALDHWHLWFRAWQQKRGLRYWYRVDWLAKRQAQRERMAEARRCRPGGYVSPVGGSRHYQGGGLGVEGGWGCPSCGADNAGPIAQGCSVCGAGRPGRHIGTEPPVPPAAPRAELPETPEGTPDDVPRDTPALRWLAEHPEATLEQAFIAGYVEGMRDMRYMSRRPTDAPPEAEAALPPEAKVARTIVAALTYFADQVLPAASAEVASGEWCSVAEVRQLIQQLTTTGEVAHA
jgi:hypothetical protein